MKRIMFGLALASVAVPAVAQVTTRYVYDARGRLVGVGNLGGATNGNAVRINHDAADNRTYYQSWNVIVHLSPGQQITSPDGRFRLVQQGDGNLVIYDLDDRVVWATNTGGH